MTNPLTIFLFSCVLGLIAHGAHAQPYTGEQSLEHLRAAITEHKEIVRAGGWRAVPQWTSTQMMPTKAQHQAARQRLIVSGDWPRNDQSVDGGQHLAAAVGRFQARHGVLANGELNAQTITEMNVSAFERLRQLQVGLERATELAQQVTSDRYVLVNIPAQELVAVQSTRVELVSAVIVGHASRPTPAMQARITGVSFHPVWNVPPGIARKDFYPMLTKNPGYFERQNIQILKWGDEQALTAQQVVEQGLPVQQVRFRRGPDANNPLGRIRINMPNAQAIFLHDTPSTPMFGWPDRSFSSGCVRVSRIVELATWVLRDSHWTASQTTQALRTGKSMQVAAASTVPVHLVYLTAWADDSGRAHFRDDLYRLQGH
jgi:murein L,D-transpeptidase YcbB/YkuD